MSPIRRHILPLFGPHRWRLIIGLTALLVVDIVQLIPPRLIGGAVDAIAEQSPINAFLVGIMLAGCAVAFLRWVWRITFGYISRGIRHDLRAALYRRVLDLGPGARRDLTSGDLIARASADIDAVGMACGFGILAAADAGIMIILVATQIPAVGSLQAAWALIPLGLLGVWVLVAGNIIHRRFGASQASLAALTEETRELLAAGRYVMGSGRSEYLLDGFHAANERQRQDAMALASINAWFDPVIRALPIIAQAVVLIVAGQAVLNGDLPLGNLIALTAYIALLTWPMMAIGWSVNLLQRGAVAAERIAGVLDRPDDIPTPAEPEQLGADTTIRVTGLDLDLGSERVLNQVSLELGPGEVVGLVGASGSGKTSLLRCLARLQAVPPGSVTYGGIPAENLTPTSVRRRIALAAQEPVLFAATVHDNIALADPEMPRERVIAAAQAAGIHDQVEDMPDGYLTLLGERGLTVSGGQRARLGLARALAGDADVVLLDDCLAAVDGDRAARIVAGLHAAIGERAALIVAHRLATVRGCDRIIVLEGGRIVEHGSHSELLSQGGTYARTWTLQHGASA